MLWALPSAVSELARMAQLSSRLPAPSGIALSAASSVANCSIVKTVVACTCGWSPASLWVRSWWPEVMPRSENTVYPTEPVNITENTRVRSQASAMAMSSLIALFVATSGSAPEVGGAAGWAGRTQAVEPGGRAASPASAGSRCVRMLAMWESRRSLSVAPTSPLSQVMSASTASSTLLRSALVASTTGGVPRRRRRSRRRTAG